MSESKKHFEKGLEHAGEKDYSMALKAYCKALEFDPNDPYIYSERAVAYFHLEEKELALKDMNKAQELQPELGYRYSSRAYIKASLGDLDGAIEDYKVAIQVDPEDAIAHNNLGLLEEQKGYKEQSKKRYVTADKLSERQKDEMKSTGTYTPEPEEKEEEDASKQKQIPIQVGSEEEQEKGSLSNYLKLIGQVFRSKTVFKDFIRFLKRGLK